MENALDIKVLEQKQNKYVNIESVIGMQYFISKETTFDDFFEHRDLLIEQFRNQEITKKEYLEKNYNFVIGMKVKPFQKIDSYEKGIFNYQYYNVMAKYHQMKAQEIKNKGKQLVYYKKYIDETNYYYNEKDKTSFRLIKFIEYENIESYFIKMESLLLKDKLYEIVLKDYEYAVLHSKSIWLLNVLRKEGVFSECVKKSIIDHYVNEKY